MEIRFYHPDEEYGFLSNYFDSPFALEGERWPTVEHYYQANKFTETARKLKVMQCKTANGTKAYAHGRKHLWRSDWDEIKLLVMRRAIQAKFMQSENLSAALLATGNGTLIENSPSDLFWGIGADDSGKNMLGVLLMETRDLLQRRNHGDNGDDAHIE